MKSIIRKAIKAGLVMTMISGLMVTGVQADEFAANPKGEVLVWGWDETEILADELKSVYPDVTINYVTIAHKGKKYVYHPHKKPLMLVSLLQEYLQYHSF